MILNNAKALYAGEHAVSAVYLGDKLVWRSILPSGYVLLKGIEGNGSQYMDTGIKGNQNTRIRCVFENTSYINTAASVFGSRSSATANSINCMIGSVGDIQLDWYDYTATRIKSAQVVALYTPVEVYVSAEKSIIRTGSESVERTIPYSKTFSTPSSIQVFRTNTKTMSLPWMILREFDMWDGDTQIVHLVPCINPDGIVGCYDTIRRVFLTNAGKGSFSAVHT